MPDLHPRFHRFDEKWYQGRAPITKEGEIRMWNFVQ